MDTSQGEGDGLRLPEAADAVVGGVLLAGTVTARPKPAQPGGIGPELDCSPPTAPAVAPGLPPLDQGRGTLTGLPSQLLRPQRRVRQQQLLPRLRTIRQS